MKRKIRIVFWGLNGILGLLILLMESAPPHKDGIFDSIMGLLLIVFGFLDYVVFVGGVGYAIGDKKGLGKTGALYGLFLGPLGWLITLTLPNPADGEKMALEKKRVELLEAQLQEMRKANSLAARTQAAPTPRKQPRDEEPAVYKLD